MWVFRSHTIGSPYTECYRKVRNRYISEVKRGVLPTHVTMEEWIERKMDKVHEATFSIEVPADVADACLVESSMESYYEDMLRGSEVKVIGTRTRKRIRCAICLQCKFTKIKVTCGHIFHRRCIDEWARWRCVCPVCDAALRVKEDVQVPPPRAQDTQASTAACSDEYDNHAHVANEARQNSWSS